MEPTTKINDFSCMCARDFGQVYELVEVQRQKGDDDFIRVLSEVRKGMRLACV